MFSTPLSYKDNPTQALKALSDLEKPEATYFAIGYVQGCEHIIETLVDTRSKYLTMAISTEDRQKIQKISSITKTLDILEETIKKRVSILEAFLTKEQDL